MEELQTHIVHIEFGMRFYRCRLLGHGSGGNQNGDLVSKRQQLHQGSPKVHQFKVMDTHSLLFVYLRLDNLRRGVNHLPFSLQTAQVIHKAKNLDG